jgi:protein involved in polysaccharide export with SLBB domain
MNYSLPGWRAFSALLLLTLAPAALADDASPGVIPTANVPANTNLSLSVPSTQARAPWQQHLTLGAGDILDFGLLNPDPNDIKNPLVEVRGNVAIGPDGRVTYLQAQDIMAAGLTIEELRAKMDGELGKYYRTPHSVITPVTIRSKKFYILGAVVTKGDFIIDHPLTLIEAIARAGGLETGVFERNTVEIADLSHSFMIRGGKRLPIDFEKLFQHGDLTQNIPMEPNDYVFFASSSVNEVYILGEVNTPGLMPYMPNASVLTAITARGGFTYRAFRSRVLVVRGSLRKPEKFVVNTGDILDAKTPDFRLQPRDIVYVAPKPWAKAEELLDVATSTFIQSVVVTYTGDKVGPFISSVVK